MQNVPEFQNPKGVSKVTPNGEHGSDDEGINDGDDDGVNDDNMVMIIIIMVV